MLKINKIKSDRVIDFATEELQKYYRMMMPQVNEVQINYAPEAKDGFRLGLLEDFGIENEAKDPRFDDVIHIDADVNGGILAGSNPRSVLFAVYRFFKLQGCRWLFPGPEGEFIPMKKIEKQFYHKAADHRFRGHTIEGAPSVRQVLSYIDFHAKEELNTFGLLQVDTYQQRYYFHKHNEKNRPEEGYDPAVAEEQWRSLYESELQKRGQIQFSGEHELVAYALGLKCSDRNAYASGKKKFPPEIYQYLALYDGKRDFYRNDLYYSQLCMSNPEVQRRMVEAAVKAVKENPHFDYYGMTVGDISRHHCQCEECVKTRPADKYVKILNMIDERLTKEGLDTKIIISSYTDMMFAPETEKIKNPDRFILQYCPIYRSYTSSITEDSVFPEPLPFKYNDWEAPDSAEAAISLLKQWQKDFSGPVSIFEYHFWIKQYRDPGSIDFARRVYEDTLSYKILNMQGCMEDGSNRSFFPNGFPSHIYAETMMNRDLDYEKEFEDYYSHLYGSDWKMVKDYLQKITDAFDFGYMLAEKSKDPTLGNHYNPDRVPYLAKVKEIAKEMRDKIDEHTLLPIRPQAIAWRLLKHHADWCEGIAKVMIEKCQGNTDKATELMQNFVDEFGKREYEIEDYFDFYLAVQSLFPFIRKKILLEQIV